MHFVFLYSVSINKSSAHNDYISDLVFVAPSPLIASLLLAHGVCGVCVFMTRSHFATSACGYCAIPYRKQVKNDTN